jgi:hypothetical protein
MKALKIFLAALFVLTLGLSIQGCSSLTGSNTPSQGDDFYDDSFFEDMNFDINDENGGYDTSREEPGFGDASFFSMFTEDEPANDPWSNDPGTIAMGENPSNVVAYARLVWGQLQFNPESTDSTDWSGSIWVDSGALVVKRLIRFEPGTDWVEERGTSSQIDLVSETTTHNDGLLIQVINDEPGLGEANLLHVELGDFVYSIPVDSLDGYTEVVDVDEAGNQFSLHSVRVLDCPNGFMNGIWVDGETDAGIFRGGWFSWEGELMGHYRGHWGISDDGENVFRGKLIDLDGNFWAMLRGRWVDHQERHGDGDYHGQWLTPIGGEGSDEFEAVGSIWGFYRKGFMSRGHMGGRWMEWCE